MTIDGVRQELEDMLAERQWKKFHTGRNLAEAIAVEAGELLQLFLWNREPDLDSIADELSDLFIFTIAMADAVGVDLESSAWTKMRKNRKRKWNADGTHAKD